MKKILIFLTLILCSIFSLTGCGSSNDSKNASSSMVNPKFSYISDETTTNTEDFLLSIFNNSNHCKIEQFEISSVGKLNSIASDDVSISVENNIITFNSGLKSENLNGLTIDLASQTATFNNSTINVKSAFLPSKSQKATGPWGGITFSNNGTLKLKELSIGIMEDSNEALLYFKNQGVGVDEREIYKIELH